MSNLCVNNPCEDPPSDLRLHNVRVIEELEVIQASKSKKKNLHCYVFLLFIYQ